MGGISSSMGFGASAMNAFGLGMAVSAHNIANTSTSGFVPQRAAYVDLKHGGMGLNAVLREGPLANWSAANAVYDVTPSGTDMAVEMTRIISTQHAYAANAHIVRASDSMLGTLLDIKA